MKGNIKAWSARMSRHRSKHVQRFAPLISPVIEAMTGAGLSVTKRYTNQILIEDQWVGCYQHGHRNDSGRSRIAIYDIDAPPPSNSPILVMHNEADAKLFATTVKFTKRALGFHLSKESS